MNGLIKILPKVVKQAIQKNQTGKLNIFCSQSPRAIISSDVITTAMGPSWRLFSIQIVDDSDMSFLK